MKIRKRGYWWLLILTILFVVMAAKTIIPAETASKNCMLGYKAYCTFAPISTILCLMLAGMVCFIRKIFFVSYK